ncbi:MAG: hypothetical protein MHM6MM_005242 [Cercozoa sp. M6MM]
MQEDLYEILEVAESASLAEIKSAYRRAVLRAHPDRGGTPAQFRRVHLAWQTLGDSDRRRRYDWRRNNAQLSADLVLIETTLGEMELDDVSEDEIEQSEEVDQLQEDDEVEDIVADVCQQVFVARCRCGGRFRLRLSRADVLRVLDEPVDIVVPCALCSFVARVRCTVEDLIGEDSDLDNDEA